MSTINTNTSTTTKPSSVSKPQEAKVSEPKETTNKPAVQESPQIDTKDKVTLSDKAKTETIDKDEDKPETENKSEGDTPKIDPAAIHMNQFTGDPNGSNADCGPTSLAMALKGLGLTDPNQPTLSAVQDTRKAMFPNNAAKDGLDDKGNRADGEHSTFTNTTDIITGAQAMGANAKNVNNMNDITTELQAGHPVVLAGNGTFPPSSYKDGHFVTVSGYNAETGTYTVNDPTGKGPVEVTKEQLEAYAKGQGGIYGVAISRGDGKQVAPADGQYGPAVSGGTPADGNTAPAAQTGTAAAGAPVDGNTAVNPAGTQTGENITGQQNAGPVISPTGAEISQDAGNMIMSAWQEMMSGNFNGPAMQKLYEWYMQGDKNSQDPVRVMAGNMLQMAGMIVPQNGTGNSGGIPPHISRLMQMQQI